jgi:hypothetical protein
MRLAERKRGPESHFTEGELDLEPPEELAIGEVDEDAMLEEELDNEDILEEDVDEDTLEVTLEDLVHGGDEDGEEHDGDLEETHVAFKSVVVGDLDDADADGAMGDDDVEEGLDLVLLDRLALVDLDGADSDDEDAPGPRPALHLMRTDTVELGDVVPRRTGEFVCRSCFLVRTRAQLVDVTALVCRDCSA